MICGNAFPQSVDDNAEIDISLSFHDLKQWDKESQEYPMLKQLITEQANTIGELRNSLDIKSKELELEKRENDLNKRIIELKDKEIAVLNDANDKLKDVTDRALKLAEVSKPKSNWMYAVVGVVAAFLIGLGIGL